MLALLILIPLYLLALMAIIDALKANRKPAVYPSSVWPLGAWLAAFENHIYLRPDSFMAHPDYSTQREYTGYAIINHDVKANKNGDRYLVELGAGIEPMCGEAWLDANWNNLKDYKPEMSISLPGYTNTFKLNDLNKSKQVIQSTINRTMLKAIEPELYKHKSYFKKANLVPAMA